MGSLRTSLFTGDGVSKITAESVSHTQDKVTHSDRLTACVQSPCPGPVSLNVSFVSGCLGFPPERTEKFFHISLLFVVGVKADEKTDAVLSEGFAPAVAKKTNKTKTSALYICSRKD